VDIVKKKTNNSCCEGATSCKIESLISVDERGQMVLPKELRDKANIRPGDKLAVASWERDGKICCLTLVKAEELADMMKGVIGPVMKELL
jgi:AbrB family looped-hinge helix DNA binding protein